MTERNKISMDWKRYMAQFKEVAPWLFLNDTGTINVLYQVHDTGIIIECSDDFIGWVKYVTAKSPKEIVVEEYILAALMDVDQHYNKIKKIYKKEKNREIKPWLFREYTIE